MGLCPYDKRGYGPKYGLGSGKYLNVLSTKNQGGSQGILIEVNASREAVKVTGNNS